MNWPLKADRMATEHNNRNGNEKKASRKL